MNKDELRRLTRVTAEYLETNEGKWWLDDMKQQEKGEAAAEVKIARQEEKARRRQNKQEFDDWVNHTGQWSDEALGLARPARTPVKRQPQQRRKPHIQHRPARTYKLEKVSRRLLGSTYVVKCNGRITQKGSRRACMAHIQTNAIANFDRIST